MFVDWLTWRDIFGCLRAVVTFAPVLLAPGYCLAWATNLVGFRTRSLGERLAWGVVLSFGVMTIAAVELAKYGSLSSVCWLAGACAAGFAGILATDGWKQVRGGWSMAGAGVAGVWVLFVVLELVDVGVGNRLYLSFTVFDHSVRAAFVDAVMRMGVPPANPFYWPGHAAAMSYYYFWYVLAAVAAKLGRATARQAMIASVVWSGFGLAATVALYCRNFMGSDSDEGIRFGASGRRWPRTAVALTLLAVTGLDLLPVLVKALLRMPTDPDMEWWSGDQVTSWADSVLWVPHHIAGLVCCLVGFLLVWMAKGRRVGEKCLCGLIAGLSFASAFGLSTWVPLAFAIAMAAWILWATVWDRESRPRVPVLLGAGLVAVVALMPYLTELRAARKVATEGSYAAAADSSIAGSATHLLSIHFRRILDPECLWSVPGFVGLTRIHPLAGRLIFVLAKLVVLPVAGYFLELGFYGLVLVMAWRAMGRARLDEAARTALFLASVVLLVSTYLGSTVIASNDFGWRAVLIAQFFLLLLAVQWCENGFGVTSRRLRIAMYAMAWIGLAGTVYQVAELRVYLPVEDRLGRPGASGLAERAMVLRQGFDELDRKIPVDAIVQYNIAQPSSYFLHAQILETRRQTASGLQGCGVAFGGDPRACAGIDGEVLGLFSLEAGPEGARQGASPAEAQAVCARLGVGYLVATRWDEVWTDPADWVWRLPAVVNTGDLRAVSCAGRGSD